MGGEPSTSQCGQGPFATSASRDGRLSSSVDSSLSTLESLSREFEKTEIVPTSSLGTISMITPWKQECGNAEYAERLCVALAVFSKVTPFDLRNFTEDFELRSKASVRKHFGDLVRKINSQDSDIVHIQHEYCFFGRSIQRSNHEFLCFTERINKPIVVTLHTWLESNVNPTRKLKSFFKRPLNFIRESVQRKDFYKALCRCKAIVVHSHDTYTQLVSTYPKLRKRVHIIQIPIASIASSDSPRQITKKLGDVWMVLPGFVSPYKGHGDAINALEHLPENFKLVIAGGRHPKDRGASRYWMELLGVIEAKGLQDKVLFTGFLATGGEQAAILKQADLFILPYKEVGQSGSAVLADALAYDRPVVTSRARSMFAYRMSQDCVYSSVSTDVSDAKNFATQIQNSFLDKAEDSHVASQRKAAVKRYSLSSIGFAYEQLYKDVRGESECVSA